MRADEAPVQNERGDAAARATAREPHPELVEGRGGWLDRATSSWFDKLTMRASLRTSKVYGVRRDDRLHDEQLMMGKTDCHIGGMYAEVVASNVAVAIVRTLLGVKMKNLIAALACAVLVSSCASSSVTQLSRNSAIISTSAAPACRTTGAATVANQMAAVATIKAGYERFVVSGFGTQNNTQVVSTGPTHSSTSGSFQRYGNTIYGSSNTNYGGQMTYLAGSNNAEMQIYMLNPGDAGFGEGIDAKSVLGPEWQKKVESGINSCF